MATFADLPSDIIIAIARFERPDNMIVSGWKHTLRIMSICHSWRVAMLPVVYATVFIAIPQDGFADYPTARRMPHHYNIPYTNAGLIYENGYGSMAKRMSITSQSTGQVPFPWLYVAEALKVDEDKYPGILAVRKWIETDTDAEYQLASQNIACINAFGPIAHTLAHRFPNVRCLEIKANEYSSSTQTDVLSKLVSAYASQLVKVNLDGFKVNQAFLKATNIRYFDQKLFNVFQDAPFINPESLICLKLHNISSNVIWNRFVCDNDTNSIEFTNLESLHLYCGYSNDNELQNTKIWHIKFPKLTHLKINYAMVPSLDFQHTSMNLKTLDFTGCCGDIIKLLKNNIGSLENLHLKLGTDADEDDDIRWPVPQANTLFNMVGTIKEVSCMDLYAKNCRTSSIFWPNLTRLELITNIKPYDFLRSIDRIPHLQHLHLIIMFSSNEESDIEDSDADNHYAEYTRRDRYANCNWPSIELSQLSDLKRSEQLQSKLATLSIHWFTDSAYQWHSMKSNLELNVTEDQALVNFLRGQPICQAKRSRNLDSDYRIYGFYYDSNNGSLRSSDGDYGEVHMEDAEADAALRAYFPNLVTTTFVDRTSAC